MRCLTQKNKWREQRSKPHKFSEIDVDHYRNNRFGGKFKYFFVYAFALKNVLAYMADIGVVIMTVYNFFGKNSLLRSFDESTRNPDMDSYVSIMQKSPIKLSMTARLAIICSTIFLSFVFLAFEWHRGMKIVRSQDISMAFTNDVSYYYYILRSYPHYCFFKLIEYCRKGTDKWAFFTFQNLRSWKRLIIAELPRIIINILTLVDIFLIVKAFPPTDLVCNNVSPCPNGTPGSSDLALYLYFTSANTNKAITLQVWLTTISVGLWGISFLILVTAFFVYVPLVFNIKGNLKEFCVKAMDRHLDEILDTHLENPLKSNKVGNKPKPVTSDNYYADSNSDSSSSNGGYMGNNMQTQYQNNNLHGQYNTQYTGQAYDTRNIAVQQYANNHGYGYNPNKAHQQQFQYPVIQPNQPMYQPQPYPYDVNEAPNNKEQEVLQPEKIYFSEPKQFSMDEKLVPNDKDTDKHLPEKPTEISTAQSITSSQVSHTSSNESRSHKERSSSRLNGGKNKSSSKSRNVEKRLKSRTTETSKSSSSAPSKINLILDTADSTEVNAFTDSNININESDRSSAVEPRSVYTETDSVILDMNSPLEDKTEIMDIDKTRVIQSPMESFQMFAEPTSGVFVDRDRIPSMLDFNYTMINHNDTQK